MTEKIPNATEHDKEEPEKAVLVSLCTRDMNEELCRVSLNELQRLLDTAGGCVFAEVTQAKSSPDPRTCIGSGKVAEVAELCKNNGIGLVVFDCELSPSQIRNLEDDIGDDVRVIDRSMLILDIFARHAASREGKLQVQLAQLKYTIPRLTGKGAELSRLGGGIGTRGPGESKLERDKRHVKRQIDALEAEIRELEQTRIVKRKQREKSGIPKMAIAGYTNAGKSTLLNRLTDAGILAEDKLFATLDPTTRKFTLPDGMDVLLTDTVGFIRNLPHHLISAFRSTLDEVACADFLLILMDASDPEFLSQLEVTEKLLTELGADGKPTLYVMNKMDLCAQVMLPFLPQQKKAVQISARTGEGIDRLTEALVSLVREGKQEFQFFFDHSRQNLLQILYKSAAVSEVQYTDEGVLATATVDTAVKGLLADYIMEREEVLS